MSNNLRVFASVVLSSIIFTFLFYRSAPGINLVIFEIALIGIVYANDSSLLRKKLVWLTSAGFLWSGIMVFLHASGWALFVNILGFFLMIGVFIYSEAKSYLTSLRLTILNFFTAPFHFIQIGFDLGLNHNPKVKGVLRHYYLLAPAVIIALFLAMYSGSNPVFNGYVANYLGSFTNLIQQFFNHLDGVVLGLFLLGMVISVWVFARTANKESIAIDQEAKLELERSRNPLEKGWSKMAFKNEFRSGIFLFVALNLMLAIVNTIDIYWVWFNFEWDGDYLKQFVHEGTYLLILSIFISMALVLFYFRGNQNFYSKRIWLQRLCYIWMIQNAILAVSVVIRNMHYIEYFNLAYKRIGVMFFLALVLFGIYTVIIKVQQRKSAFYLIRQNIAAIFLVLVISTSVNWDVVIARYNFSHADKAFVHFDYLAGMSPAAFEYMDIELDKLQAIQEQQTARYPSEVDYMSAIEFRANLDRRMTQFEENYRERNWKEWNWADAQAKDYLAQR